MLPAENFGDFPRVIARCSPVSRFNPQMVRPFSAKLLKSSTLCWVQIPDIGGRPRLHRGSLAALFGSGARHPLERRTITVTKHDGAVIARLPPLSWEPVPRFLPKSRPPLVPGASCRPARIPSRNHRKKRMGLLRRRYREFFSAFRLRRLDVQMLVTVVIADVGQIPAVPRQHQRVPFKRKCTVHESVEVQGQPEPRHRAAIGNDQGRRRSANKPPSNRPSASVPAPIRKY